MHGAVAVLPHQPAIPPSLTHGNLLTLCSYSHALNGTSPPLSHAHCVSSPATFTNPSSTWFWPDPRNRACPGTSLFTCCTALQNPSHVYTDDVLNPITCGILASLSIWSIAASPVHSPVGFGGGVPQVHAPSLTAQLHSPRSVLESTPPDPQWSAVFPAQP